MKKVRFFLFALTGMIALKSLGQELMPVTISVGFLPYEIVSDEWIHLRIVDSIDNQVKYDTSATVIVPDGFKDTVYLSPGTYKCEILGMGVYVKMPEVKINKGDNVPWGYPAYEYYLIKIPGQLTTLVQDKINNSLVVFPNPIISTLNIESEFAKVSTLELYNLSGVRIFWNQSLDQNKIQINLSNLSSGIYFIHLKGVGINQNFKIIKK
jgi:hypothetical protein